MPTWPYNFHTHTPYGDGHSSAAEYAREAVDRGMAAIGLSEHGPLGPDISWTVSADSVEAYRAEVMALRREYAGTLQIFCGLECDWWPLRAEWLDRAFAGGWDYLIGSVHFVTTSEGTWQVDESPAKFQQGVDEAFGGNVRAACDAFWEMERQAALSGRFQILAHLDLVKKYNKDCRFFDPRERWYQEMAFAAVDAAARAGIIVEVNTAGLDKPIAEYYPSPQILERCIEKKVRLTLSADAHRAQDVQRHFDTVGQELYRLGVRELWKLGEGGWGAEGMG